MYVAMKYFRFIDVISNPQNRVIQDFHGISELNFKFEHVVQWTKEVDQYCCRYHQDYI